MNWSALALIVVGLAIVATGGAALCHGFGHALRPKDRQSLAAREESEIAIVASRWAALPPEEQALALATLLRGAALRSKSVGAVLRDFAGGAADAHERPLPER